MEKMKKSRQGFTLIELLATVLIMSLVIGIVLLSNAADVKEKSEIKLDETSKNLILSAAKSYVLEYRNKKDNWKENVDSNGNVSFCVSLNSLLEAGYYKTDDRYVVDNASNLRVYTEIDKNKVSKYNILSRNDANFHTSCGYEIIDSDLGTNGLKGTVNIENDTGNKDVGSFGYEVKQNQDKINNYEVNIKFSATLGTEDITTNAPVYVAIVLDKSGSMTGSFEAAKTAAISLSTQIINKLSESYVALIQYNEQPKLTRDFMHQSLGNDDFDTLGGDTNVSGGLDLVSSLYKKIINDENINGNENIKNAKFFTILLYDGVPTHTSVLNDLYYNSSPYYYGNFYNAYWAAYCADDSNYKYWDSYCKNVTSRYEYSNIKNNTVTYVKNAAKELLGIGIDSKLITIGYYNDNNKNITFSADLKEISSINQNEDSNDTFCKDSDYVVNEEKQSKSPEDITIKMEQYDITHGFKVDNGALVSTIDSLNMQSYGYYKLDLNAYLDKNVAVKFEYDLFKMKGSFHIDIVAADDFADNKFVGDIFLQKVCSSPGKWQDNHYCDFHNSNYNTKSVITEEILEGGKEYYINLYFYRYDEYDTKVKIKNISYSVANENAEIYNSKDVGYEEYLTNDIDVTLSTANDSKLVFPFLVTAAGKLDSSNNTSNNQNNSYTAGYQKIDLTGKSGKYLLTVNVTSSTMGYIKLSTSDEPQYAPAVSTNFSGLSYSASGCNTDEHRCILANTEDANFNFMLSGGNVYYVHYLGKGKNLVFNNISLNKVSDSIVYETNFDTVASNSCEDNSEDIVGCLQGMPQEENSYEKHFKYNVNGSIISSNQEIGNSCSRSYVKLNLKDKKKYTGENVIVEFNSTISSQSGYDIGNIIISGSNVMPSLTNRTCTMNNSGQGCVYYSSGSNSGTTRYWNLNVGQEYYVHFTYCKDDTNSIITSSRPGDYFQINGLKIYNVEENKTVKFSKDDTTILDSDEVVLGGIVDYIDYAFDVTDDNQLISTNGGVSNSVSHRYLKIDLCKQSNNKCSIGNDKKFIINVDAKISHDDIGMVILTDVSTASLYVNSSSSSNTERFFLASKGENIEESSGDITVYGGKIYYLHFVYYKNATDNKYDDLFSITSVKVFKEDKGEETPIDLSNFVLTDTDLSKMNYAFVQDQESGKYVSNNKDVSNTSAISYFELDLSNDSDKKYVLKIDAILSSNVGENEIWVVTSNNRPFGVCSTTTIGVDYMCSPIRYTKNNTYNFELSGGNKYYIYILHENNDKTHTFTINSIKLYEKEISDSKHYCYYDSNSENIGGLFDDLSNTVTESVKNLSADKARLTLSPVSGQGISFDLVNSNGDPLPDNKIVEIIELEAGEDNKFEFNDTYRLVLKSDGNESVCSGEGLCNINLFDVKLELISDGEVLKTIEIKKEDLPTFTINYEAGEAVN